MANDVYEPENPNLKYIARRGCDSIVLRARSQEAAERQLSSILKRLTKQGIFLNEEWEVNQED